MNHKSDQEKIDQLINRKLDRKTEPKPNPKEEGISKIRFTPLHEGMGFHPFSDGLPYAPESKAKYSGGSGATSAGRPSFAAPQTVNQTSKPMGTARQLQQQIPTPNQTPKRQPMVPVGATSAGPISFNTRNATLKTTVPAPEVTKAEVPEKIILRRRVFAYLMDTTIHAGFWLATNLTALFFFKFQIDSEILKDNFLQFFIFFLVSQWLFVALQEMLFETSIGKVFFNLEFKRNHRSLLLRSVVFLGGMIFFGLGLYFRPQDRLGKLQLKQKIYAS